MTPKGFVTDQEVSAGVPVVVDLFFLFKNMVQSILGSW